MDNTLSEGWVWAKVDNLIGRSGDIKDGDWILSKDFSPGGEIRLIQLGDIGVGYFLDKSSKYISKRKAKELNCTLLKPGDLLISRMAYPIARACIVPKLGYDCITAVDVTILRLDFEISSARFISWLFNSNFIRKQAEKLSSGTTRKRISRKKLEKLDVPLPPLPEQNKIVERIEELFTKLDVGVEALKKVKEQIKQYRQSVLKSAFEGKLTAEWRKENPNPEKYLENLRERIEVFNREKRNKDKPSRLPPIDFSDLAEIPFPWIWIKAHKVCQSVRDGTHDTPKYVNKGIPLVTSKNLVKGRIDFTNVNYISTEDHLEINKRSKVDQGDILFGMIGTIGNPVIVKTDSIFSIKNVGLFKRNDNFILFKYLRYWLKSEELKRMLEKKHLIRGTTQKFIALGNLRVLPIPLPTLKEQQKIVEEIEKRFSIADEVEKTVDESLEQAEKLRQSILKKAFEGKLTEKWREQHPELVSGENSAEKLLEKIKEEKTRMEAEMKNKKKRKKK